MSRSHILKVKYLNTWKSLYSIKQKRAKEYLTLSATDFSSISILRWFFLAFK